MEKQPGIAKLIFKNFSYLLLLQLLPILYISSSLVDEINHHLFQKQMIYYMIAFVAFIVAMFIPWRRIMWWFSPLSYLQTQQL